MVLQEDLTYVLTNGPVKKENNNYKEYVAMQNCAKLTVVCTKLLIGLNSKS